MKYPTRGGLIIPPMELGYTEQTNRIRGVTNLHHGYYCKGNYRDPVGQIFRSLEINTYPLLIPEHNELHDQFDAPQRPSDVKMIDFMGEQLAIHGILNRVREGSRRPGRTFAEHDLKNLIRGVNNGRNDRRSASAPTAIGY